MRAGAALRTGAVGRPGAAARRVLRRLRAGLRRRERVVPVVLPATRRRWQQAPPDDWAAALHLHYLRHRDAYLPSYFAKFQAYPTPRNRLTRAWRWYVSDVLLQSVKLLRGEGRRLRAEAGVPLRRQLRDLLWLSVSLPSMPENYYKFELFRPGNRARAGDYLHRHETKGALYEMLAGRPDLDRFAPLNDKVAFAAHARAAGLPVVPTVALISDGAVSSEAAPAGELPAADLFVKPLAGKGGRGAQRWRYLPDADRFREGASAGAPEVPRDRLLRLLGDRSAGGPLLVQTCLTNHPDLADLALDAVPTCRIITMIDESGEPEPVIAIFRMPAVTGAIVDNMHRGGVAAPVEVDSGVLGPAAGYATTRHTHHPVSGGAIEGRKLPRWDEARELAVRAHRAFRPRVLVGWDLSVGPAGPVLVEGNEQPGVDGLQRLHDLPLGSHRFGELLAHHLAGAFPR